MTKQCREEGPRLGVFIWLSSKEKSPGRGGSRARAEGNVKCYNH